MRYNSLMANQASKIYSKKNFRGKMIRPGETSGLHQNHCIIIDQLIRAAIEESVPAHTAFHQREAIFYAAIPYPVYGY